MKKCSSCKTPKEISAFDRDKGQTDGRNRRCKLCRKIDSKKYYQKNKDKILKRVNAYYQKNKEVKRQYQQRPDVRARTLKRKHSAKYRQQQKEYRQRPERVIANRLQYQRDRNKRRANSAVRKAVVNGTLKPANSYICNKCNNTAEMYHHHKGYAKKHWLDVEPVCYFCHNNLHLSLNPLHS